MSSKSGLLNLLINSKDPVSGQDLATALKVSRNAVWKQINDLKQQGFGIEADNNKGYLLTKYPVTVNELVLRSLLQSEPEVSVHIKDEVDSTNNWARSEASKGAADLSFYFARTQTGGRGRLNRRWESPPGGLYFSFIIRPSVSLKQVFRLTIVAAVALHKALRRQGVACKIKWPNDILTNNGKISGILTESSVIADTLEYAVIGIGLNIAEPNSRSIDRAVSCLDKELSAKVCINALAASIIKELASSFKSFTEDEWKKTQKYFNEHHLLAGEEIQIKENGRTISGKVAGLSENGALNIKTKKGVTEFYSAETTRVNDQYELHHYS